MKTKTILPAAILFAAIQAKKQGTSLNLFVSKNARCFNAAIRSFWLTVKITFSKVLHVKNGVIVHSDFNSFEVGTNADLPYLTKWIERYNRLGVVSVTGLAQLVVLWFTAY